VTVGLEYEGNELTKDQVDVSIVLPVYNERGHLQDEIERIRKAMDTSPYSYEIIVVDDGSTDGSSEALKGLHDIRLIQYAKNRGSGFARRAGTHAARGTYVVWTDVDMTYPNEDLPRLVEELVGHDQVVGARTSEQGTMKLARVPAKWIIRKFAEFLTGTQFPDLNSGLRVFRRAVAAQYLHLMPNGFSHVTTLTMAFLGNDYSIKYLPIDYHPRAGRSKFHWFTDTQRYILQVTRMAMLYQPMKVFMPPALLLFLAGVGKTIFDMVTKDLRIATNTITLLLTALGVIVVGLLADLIVQLNKDHNVVDPAALYESPIPGDEPADGAGSASGVLSGQYGESPKSRWEEV
jgi:glycosyltransferase involved in cell wall biosynthesis